MIREQLLSLVKRCDGRIINLGGEIGTSTQHALEVVDALEKIGVLIMGIDGWYEAGPPHPPKRAVQDLEVYCPVSDHIMNDADAVNLGAKLVRNYIQHSLKPNTAYISFTLDIPTEWDLFNGD